MAPSIRVTQESYEGLRTMIEKSYAKTISAVIERFLKEEGVIPLEQSNSQSQGFEGQDKSEANIARGPFFSETEEDEFTRVLGESIPKYRFQRDAMRDVFSKYNGEKEKVIKAYAWMEEKGYAPRKNNKHHFSPMYYAEALYNDGIKKGWLQ